MQNTVFFKKNLPHILFYILLLPLVAGLTGAGICFAQTPASFADLAEEVAHSVVNISTTQAIQERQTMPWPRSQGPFEEFFEKFFGDIPQQKRRTRALGSGFIIDKEGHIFTNNHVVAKASEINVRLQNGEEYKATIVGRDPKTDLALIKIEADGDLPPPAQLGDSTSIRVGDWTLAVGNPFGLGHTVTAGIIGAKSRIIGAGPYDDFLQTDAAINPGNSGGPLFNKDGKVIGISTAIVAEGQGIGFAIPVNIAKNLLPQLKQGKVTRGFLGISIQDLTPELAESFGLKHEEGVLIAQVMDDTPAEKAGLKPGDVITSVNGNAVETAHDLSARIAGMKPDTKVDMKVLRDGEEMTISAELGTMPGTDVSEDGGDQQPSDRQKQKWGLSVQDITPEISQQLKLKFDEGVIIMQVQPGSPADNAGLQQGDIIREVERKEISNMREFLNTMQKLDDRERLLLQIQRNDRIFYVVLQSS
ncbi:MAG: DegQ family serine endoprotease [Syntrophales bacterium]|nr:DegQ family serine endoprotease [Syntrophales bacterium]MDY0045342.1 DegQ family serine endoprotease [Syntrophales bacterium]